MTAVAGVPSERGAFYMGASGGGVWKSTDYGQVWENRDRGDTWTRCRLRGDRVGTLLALAEASG